MSLKFESIAAAPELRVARIVLDRPPLNIIDVAAAWELHHAIAAAEREANVAALVISAAGPNFSAGVEVRDHAPERIAEMLPTFHGMLHRLAGTELLTFCTVQGICLGGGCELTTVCDFVVAGEDAEFGFPEIRLACFPPVAAVILPRAIGRKRATELILTGKRISAEEARELGLLTTITPDPEAGLQALLSQVFSNSVAALRIAKRAIRQGLAEGFERRLAAVQRLYLNQVTSTADSEEGVRAFLEKRPPQWKHR